MAKAKDKRISQLCRTKGWEQLPAWCDSSESSLPGLQRAAFLQCPHRVARELAPVSCSSREDTYSPRHGAALRPLPNAPLPNAIGIQGDTDPQSTMGHISLWLSLPKCTSPAWAPLLSARPSTCSAWWMQSIRGDSRAEAGQNKSRHRAVSRVTPLLTLAMPMTLPASTLPDSSTCPKSLSLYITPTASFLLL